MKKSMVRLLVLYTQPNDVEAFERHYHDVHVPLVKKLAGLKRYTISRNIAPRRGGDAYYLVAELEWETLEASKSALQSPEGQATSQDVANLEVFSPGVRSMIYELEEL
jgi:uncharacterized protein (TIGR02118 family)